MPLVICTPQIDALCQKLDAVVKAEGGMTNGEQMFMHAMCLASLFKEVTDTGAPSGAKIIETAFQFILAFSADPTHPKTRAYALQLGTLLQVDVQIVQ